MGENWIKNKETVSDKDVSAALKADKMERKKNTRWMAVGKNYTFAENTRSI